MMEQPPPITATLTRYGEPDWLFQETLESLVEQQNVLLTVLVLDQKPSKAIANFCSEMSSDKVVFDYREIQAKSLSYARNKAIELCETDILLYIDTDAIAAPDWAYELSRAMIEKNASIAGGKIVPKWHRPTGLLQKSNLVLDQYSMLDLGDSTQEVVKVVGANFGLNIRLLGDLATFNENLGRKDGKLLGGEETELCSNARLSGLSVLYVGKSQVQHQVLPERITFKWIAKRMYYGGYSRALRGGKPEPNNVKNGFSKEDYFALTCLLPFYLFGYMKAKAQVFSQRPMPGIIFLYKRFYPVYLGSDVHGYNLAKSLHQNGYQIFTAHGQEDGFTQSMRAPKAFFQALFKSKLAYLRISLKHPFKVNSVGLLFKLLGKKLVLEFNAPFEELGFDQHSASAKKEITLAKKHFRFLLKFTDGIVTVSEPLKRHLLNEYGFDNTVVIPNGGEKFVIDDNHSDTTEPGFTEFKKTYPKHIVWVASYEYIQGMEEAQIISQQCAELGLGLVVVDNSPNGELAKIFVGSHVYFLRNPSRELIASTVAQSIAGIAFYDTKKYVELGLEFYNSPLKIYEYLANGLSVISNLTDRDIPFTYGRMIPIEQLVKLVEVNAEVESQQEYRSWDDAANESIVFFKSLNDRIGIQDE